VHPACADDEVGKWGGGEDDGCEVGVVGLSCGVGVVRLFLFVGDQVVVCCWYWG